MKKIDLNSMNREEKIELLKQIAAGQAKIIDGYLFDSKSVMGIFFDEQGRCFIDEAATEEISQEVIEKSGESFIYLPIRGKEFKGSKCPILQNG